MSTKYVYIILIAAILITVCELFPPWLYQDRKSLVYYSAGYHWRFDPPQLSPEEANRLVGREPNYKTRIIVGDGIVFEPLPPIQLQVFQNQTRLRGQEILVILAGLGCFAFVSSRRLFIALIVPAAIETILTLSLDVLSQKLDRGMGGLVQFFEFVPAFLGAACMSIYLMRRAGDYRFWQTYLFSVASASMPWFIFAIIAATGSAYGTEGYFWLGVMMLAMILAIGAIIAFPVTLLIYKSIPKTKIL